MAKVKLKWWKESIWQNIPHNHLKTHFHQRKITHLVSAHFNLTLYKLISFWLLSFAFITWWQRGSEALLQHWNGWIKCCAYRESFSCFPAFCANHRNVAPQSKNGIINKNESTDLQSCYTLHLSDNNKCNPGCGNSLLLFQAGLKERKSLLWWYIHTSNMAAVVTQPGRLFHTNERSSPHLSAKLCGLIRLTVWRKRGYWY